MREDETGGTGGEFNQGDYEIGPIYCGTINLLYSPEENELIEALEYPNQLWHMDDIGRYRLFILKVHPVPTHIKYYFIGTL